jgi:hypothetical protein
VVFPLVVAILAFVPGIETQKTLQRLEVRLRPFPPSDVVRDNVYFGRRHVRWLTDVGAMVPEHRREAYSVYMKEAERLKTIWAHLECSVEMLKAVRLQAYSKRLESRHVREIESMLHVAQQYIDDLELMLGEQDFNAGQMPPPAPVWRFQRVD